MMTSQAGRSKLSCSNPLRLDAYLSSPHTFMSFYRVSIVLATFIIYGGLAVNSRDATFTFSRPNLNRLLIAQAQQIDSSEITFLKQGQENENVKILQIKLKKLGFFNEETTGYFGEKTKLAVSQFQISRNFKSDGVVGKETWSAINTAVYDLYMKEAYEATQQKSYQIALENFQKALSERPNDAYAQQGIDNINNRLKSVVNNPSGNVINDKEQSNKQTSIFILGVSLVVIIVSVGGGLFFFLKAFRKSQESVETESLNDDDEDNLWVESKQKKTVDVNVKPTEVQANPNNQSSSLTVSNHNIVASDGANIPPSQSQPLSIQKTSRLAKVDIIEVLIVDLQKPEPARRRKAIWELAQRADSRAMEPLVELMIHADSQERSLILEAVSQIATRTLKPLNQALSIALQDKNAQVRKNAIRDLTRVYELISQVNQRLCYAATDSDKEVQETAQWALQQLHQLQSVPNFERIAIEQNQNAMNSLGESK
jgi:tetratricopeptide (TPR) repeat protein